MVVDDYSGILYLGQEQVGWWATSVSKPAANLSLVDRVREFGVPYARVFDEEEEEFGCEFDFCRDPGLGSPYLTADVEGLTIYKSGPGTGYLLVSSQGSDEFLVYDRETLEHIGNFAIGDGVVDSVEESDGMHVVNVNLGGEFTQGLLVAQDGGNTPDVLDEEGEERDNTNFKFVRWADVAQRDGARHRHHRPRAEAEAVGSVRRGRPLGRPAFTYVGAFRRPDGRLDAGDHS